MIDKTIKEQCESVAKNLTGQGLVNEIKYLSVVLSRTEHDKDNFAELLEAVENEAIKRMAS